MKLEQQVCSLNLAKRLKELGVKQNNIVIWVKDKATKTYDLWFKEVYDAGGLFPDKKWAEGYNNMLSAFTVAELGEILPWYITNKKVWAGQLMCVRHPNYFTVSYGTTKEAYCKESADTEADARAKMLIYLLQNKLITL